MTPGPSRVTVSGAPYVRDVSILTYRVPDHGHGEQGDDPCDGTVDGHLRSTCLVFLLLPKTGRCGVPWFTDIPVLTPSLSSLRSAEQYDQRNRLEDSNVWGPKTDLSLGSRRPRLYYTNPVSTFIVAFWDSGRTGDSLPPIFLQPRVPRTS